MFRGLTIATHDHTLPYSACTLTPCMVTYCQGFGTDFANARSVPTLSGQNRPWRTIIGMELAEASK